MDHKKQFIVLVILAALTVLSVAVIKYKIGPDLLTRISSGNLTYSNISVSPATVAPLQKVTVSVDVKSSVSGTAKTSMTGYWRRSQYVSLVAGVTKNVSFTFAPSPKVPDGSYDVKIGALSAKVNVSRSTSTKYNLNITNSGTGKGTVISNPSGISCGPSCSYDFNSGTSVTITAEPDSYSTFAGWSGACTGTGTCNLTTNSNKSITAVFNANTISSSTYGCGAFPGNYLGNPIGGGIGYNQTYSALGAKYVVSTAAELKTSLASAVSGDIVYVADGAIITLSSSGQMYNSNLSGFYVPAGVILAGGRGRDGITPGAIKVASSFYSNNWDYLIQLGEGAKVAGLELYGNQDTNLTGYTWSGIYAGLNSEIYNNEIHGFGYAGVSVPPDATNVWVHHNKIHHCQGAGHGYGVEVTAVKGVLSFDDDFHVASVLVEGNYFNYTRHTVANQSGKSSYTFRYNYLDTDASYESQCDVHGQNDDPGGSPDTMTIIGGEYPYCAGKDVQIYNNTTVHDGDDWFVGVRGLPCSGGNISVHNNWLKFNGADGSRIAQLMFRMPGWMYSTYEGNTNSNQTFVRMESYNNWFGTTPPPQ